MKTLLIVGAVWGCSWRAGWRWRRRRVGAPNGPAGGPAGGPPMGQEGGPPREMGGMHRGMGWGGHMHRPELGKGAGFMFRKGDAVVAIKCAESEPMKACVDAGAVLLDKLGAMNK